MKIINKQKKVETQKSKTSDNHMHLGLLTWGNWKWIDQLNGEKGCRGNIWKWSLKIILPTCN